jgi:hypothetical protein
MYFAGADKALHENWERMTGSGTAGAVLAPVAGAGVAIAVALAISGEIAVLGAVPLLVGVAVGTVVAFSVGYAVGNRGYLMIGGPVLHILVGGAAAAGVVGSRLTGLTVAGVGGVGLLLFVARVHTGNLRRHAALPANPSRVQTTKAAVAAHLLALRSGIRRMADHLLGRMALGAVWSVTTTGLLWLSAAIAAGGVSVPPSLPSETLSMVPAAGYLVALFAPFFVWTDWLGLEGVDPEMRAQFRDADSSDEASAENASTEETSTEATPADDRDGATVEDPDTATEPDEPSELPEAPSGGDDGASREEPPAEATGADPGGERAESGDEARSPAETTDGDEVQVASDRSFLDADPEELWTPGFGEESSDAPEEEIEIPGLEEDSGDDLWGGEGSTQETDTGDEPSETPIDAEAETAGSPADDGRRESDPGETPPGPRPADGGLPEAGPRETESEPAGPDPAPTGGEDDAESDTGDVTPGERVRSYEPWTDPSDASAGDGSDDAIPIYGPGAGEDDGQSEPDRQEDPEPAGNRDADDETSREPALETTGETEDRLESEDGTAGSQKPTGEERTEEERATESDPSTESERNAAGNEGVTEHEDPARDDAGGVESPDVPDDVNDPNDVEDLGVPDGTEKEDGSDDAQDGESADDAQDEVEADDAERPAESTVLEPTRPPVDIDAVEATDDEEDATPSVSRGRPVGVRDFDADGRGQSGDRTRARRGRAPRSVEGSDASVPRDGSPSPDPSTRGSPESDDVGSNGDEGGTGQADRGEPSLEFDVSLGDGSEEDRTQTGIEDGDRDVSDITDAIEEDLDRILGENGEDGDDEGGAPGDQSGVSDSVSAILSGEEDREDRAIDRNTAEEIADILSGDDDEDGSKEE